MNRDYVQWRCSCRTRLLREHAMYRLRTGSFILIAPPNCITSFAVSLSFILVSLCGRWLHSAKSGVKALLTPILLITKGNRNPSTRVIWPSGVIVATKIRDSFRQRHGDRLARVSETVLNDSCSVFCMDQGPGTTSLTWPCHDISHSGWSL